MVKTLAKWTIADYHRMIEAGLLAGRRVELLSGEIVDMAPELPIHRSTYRRGSKYIEAVLGDRAVVFTSAPVTLPQDGEPQPDICIAVPPEHRYDDHHPYPADIYWLIEVSNSTLKYDLGEKAAAYARSQIREYWVVDIPNRQLWIHRHPVGVQYQSIVKQASGQISPLAFPEVSFVIANLRQ
ncbi:MAG: Uma2 family endonuclease [Leptolyngbyaceae cyanobacterium]